jgi:hypothetical protein
MHIVDALLKNSEADLDLLGKNAAHGDNSFVPRQVEFLLCAPTEEKANFVASFFSDNRYGMPTVQFSDEAPPEESWRVLVKIVMPTTQHVLCSVSGLMECVANLFRIKYDGWGCVLQTRAESNVQGT